jgi:hypothetical protein
MMQNVFWIGRSLLLISLLFTENVTVSHRETASFGEISLVWPAPPHYTSSVSGRELLIQFSSAFNASDLEALAKQLPLWIETVTLGFDTMLIRASRDVTYAVRSENNSIVIRLDAAEPKQLKQDEEGELRLQILRAQLLVSRRQNGSAERLLEQLIAAHPDSVSALSSLAQVEQQLGRWRRSSSLYDRILQLDSNNEEARKLRSEAVAEHVGRVRADAEIRSISGDRTEHITRFSMHTPLKNDFSFGLAAADNYTTSSSRSYNRQRAELYVVKDLRDGSDMQLSAFVTRRQSGIGFRYSRPDSTGSFSAHADYRRPFWEFRETIAGYGVRDRAELHRSQQLGPALDGRLTLAINRYGLNDVGSAARSLAYDGAVIWVMRHSNPYLALEYSVDSESVHDLRPATIPLVSRQVHAGTVNGQIRLSRQITAEGSLGFVRDRLGEHASGPFVAAKLASRSSNRFSYQLWFEHRRNSVATGQILNLAGADFYWRFQ